MYMIRAEIKLFLEEHDISLPLDTVSDGWRLQRLCMSDRSNGIGKVTMYHDFVEPKGSIESDVVAMLERDTIEIAEKLNNRPDVISYKLKIYAIGKVIESEK